MTIERNETVRAEKMAAGGDALAHLADGRVVFVEGALPGETVRALVRSEKRDYAKAAVAEVLEPSPDRVLPPCPELARGCGGCGWQHVRPEAQIGLKVAVVGEALRRTGRLSDPVVVAGRSVAPWSYRTGVRLSVAGDGRVGFRAASSHRVVPVAACMVAHPALSELLAGMRVRGAGEVAVRVSAATGERSAWAKGGAAASITGVPGDVAIGPDAVVHEDVAGHRLRVNAASFFQSGPAAATLLVMAVRQACGDLLDETNMPLLDAYGGVGMFAATLGGGDSLIVESSESACADARVNLPAARVIRTAFESWRPEPVQLAVADPARAGLGRVATEVLAATGATRVVLVSCDPVSLARDSTLLAAHGFRHAGSTVLDLFPNTPHIEVVTRFDRR